MAAISALPSGGGKTTVIETLRRRERARALGEDPDAVEVR